MWLRERTQCVLPLPYLLRFGWLLQSERMKEMFKNGRNGFSLADRVTYQYYLGLSASPPPPHHHRTAPPSVLIWHSPFSNSCCDSIRTERDVSSRLHAG